MDASGTGMHTQSAQIDKVTAEKTAEDISTTQNKVKLPNLLIGPDRGEANGMGNHADGSTACMDVQVVATDPKTAINMSRKVRTSQVRPRTQNSPMRNRKTAFNCGGEGEKTGGKDGK